MLPAWGTETPPAKVELFGLLLWIFNLLVVRSPKRALIVGVHVLGAGLSFGLPAWAASDARHAPFPLLVQVAVLGALNGALGVVWCRRLEVPVSGVPMLGFTLAGVVLWWVFVFNAVTPVRLFCIVLNS